MAVRGEFGFPYTVDPAIIRGNGSDVQAFPATNEAFYIRGRDFGPISKIGLIVGTSSGHICVGHYRNSGSGRTAVPGTLLSSSGSVNCPSTGYQEISLATPTMWRPGDWFGFACDNTTATFGVLLAASNGSNNIGLGRQMRGLTQFPLASNPGSLAATVSYSFVLVGVA